MISSSEPVVNTMISSFELVVNTGSPDIVDGLLNVITIRDMVSLSRTSKLLHDCVHDIFGPFRDLAKIDFAKNGKVIYIETCISSGSIHLLDYMIKKIGTEKFDFVNYLRHSLDYKNINDHFLSKYSDEIGTFINLRFEKLNLIDILQKINTNQNDFPGFEARLSKYLYAYGSNISQFIFDIDILITQCINSKNIDTLKIILKNTAELREKHPNKYTNLKHIYEAVKLNDFEISKLIFYVFNLGLSINTIDDLKKLLNIVGESENYHMYLFLCKNNKNSKKVKECAHHVLMGALFRGKFKFIAKIWTNMEITCAVSLDIISIMCIIRDNQIIDFFLKNISDKLITEPNSITDEMFKNAEETGSIKLYEWLLTIRPEYINNDISHMSQVACHILVSGHIDLLKNVIDKSGLSIDQLNWSSILNDYEDSVFEKLCEDGDISAVKFIVENDCINQGKIDYASAYRHMLISDINENTNEIIKIIKSKSPINLYEQSDCPYYETDSPSDMCPVMYTIDKNNNFELAINYMNDGGCKHFHSDSDINQKFLAECLVHFMTHSECTENIDYFLKFATNNTSKFVVEEMFRLIKGTIRLNFKSVMYIMEKLNIDMYGICKQYMEYIDQKKYSIAFANSNFFMHILKTDNYSHLISNYSKQDIYTFTTNNMINDNLSPGEAMNILDAIKYRPTEEDISNYHEFAQLPENFYKYECNISFMYYGL